MSESDDRAVRVRRSAGTRDAVAPPPVLVSAWLLSELGHLPAVLIEQIGPDELHLHRSDADAPALRAEVTALLRDVRFAGWAVVTEADTTGTLLESDESPRVAQADCS